MEVFVRVGLGTRRSPSVWSGPIDPMDGKMQIFVVARASA
ncbi:hypothetical protein DB30_04937 [Enhygromyxa salina]|uniref:Uncharacterized protein n=1 Tax=Enhygromyxa salina TaxID=215803 RepID=A0A0C2D2S2_9BACT|nr:hypothetical protein DB30_04937 [Enhygromyxa salina]